AKSYGGVAGRDLDSCYHRACDTMENVSPELLREMSGALAYATVTFAMAQRG
ncbi:MAG: aminopeptidase, partial [Arthrobacter sp.]|nr:aminopeptidase [Arthrobacter sp.]